MLIGDKISIYKEDKRNKVVIRSHGLGGGDEGTHRVKMEGTSVA